MHQVRAEAAQAFWSGKNYSKAQIRVVHDNTTSLYLRDQHIAEKLSKNLWIDTCGSLTKTTLGLLNLVLDKVGHQIYQNGPELLIDELVWDGKRITLDEIELFDAEPLIELARLDNIVELPSVMTAERFNLAAAKAGCELRLVTHNLRRYVGLDSTFQLALFRNPRLFANYVYELICCQQLARINHMYEFPHDLNVGAIEYVSINHSGELEFLSESLRMTVQPVEGFKYPEVINVLMRC